MTPRDLIRSAADTFRLAGIPDPEYDSALLLSHICGLPPRSLRLNADADIDPEMTKRFHALCRRRISREPLQYILGETYFCGFRFQVDPRVLIPRPETELLCEWAQEFIPAGCSVRILDLCTGSGCLGVSLKLLCPDAIVTASDFSPEALEVATQNAARLEADVRFLKGDLFAAVADEVFDLIVSNPPYIPSAVCKLLQPEVMQEPSAALDGGTDGLDFYRRICHEAPSHLVAGGILLMELGDGEADRVASVLREFGFSSIEIRNDYQSLPRMICGTLS